MAQFYIIRRIGEGQWESIGVSFGNGDEAQAYVQGRNADAKKRKSRERFRVERVLGTDEEEAGRKWRERERRRFETKQYKAVAWATEPWFLGSKYADLHYIHLSEHEGGMVAYTKDEDAGMGDRQTRVRPGKYLKEYFGNVLKEPEIAKWCAVMGTTVGDSDLKFATTPDDIIRVYRRGPHSCMKAHKSSGVYGGFDLAVAYIERDGKITARTVCWPAKKRYVRIYGDGTRLQRALHDEGYSPSIDMRGARISRIPYGKFGFVMPYCDFAGVCRDEFTYLRLGYGDIPAYGQDSGHVSSLKACQKCNRLYRIECRCSVDHCWYCGGQTNGQTKDLDNEYVCQTCIANKKMRYARCCDRYLPAEDRECNCKEPQLQLIKEIYSGQKVLGWMLPALMVADGLAMAAWMTGGLG
jgi:hypothetical protein